MKTRIWAIALFVILLTGVAFPGAAQTTQPAAAHIAAAERPPALERPAVMAEPARPNTSNVKEQMVVRGRVVDASGEPQVGLRIEALLPGGISAAEARSQAGGRFVITGLQPGEYRLRVWDASGRMLPLASSSAGAVTAREVQRPFYHELVLQGEAASATNSQKDLPVTPPTGESKPPTQAPSIAPDGLLATGQITGMVTAQATGLPLASVSVYAYDENESYLASGYTDSDGLYALTGLDTGNAFVLFQVYGQNYLNEWYDNKPDFESADPVPVVDGDTTPNINATLVVGGQISGTVTAADTHLPLDYVTIYVYDEGGSTYYAGTDANGEYLVSSLPTGDYKVGFNPYSQPDYIREYYDDKPDLDTADLVHVTQGSVTSGIDAELARGGRITGQVKADDTGLPLQDVSVVAYAEDGSYIKSTSVSTSGMYTVTGLVSGSYLLNFSPYSTGSSADYIPEYYNNKYSLESADPVAVVAPNTTGGVNISLARGGKITGQVTAQGSGDPIEDVYVTLYTSNNDYWNSTVTDASGVYTFTGLMSGGYKLRFQPPTTGTYEGYVSEYYNDKSDLDTADLVNVTAPDTTSGIDAELALGGKITGQVTAQGSGDPIEDVYVTLYASNNDYWNSTVTDASGVYTFTGLMSGGYKLRFQPPTTGTYEGYIPEYYNDKSDLDTADVVNVTAPDTTGGIDAELAPGGKISGHVTAADTHLPLEDVVVDVFNSAGDWIENDSTDASGVYTVTRLASGSYYLRFYPSNTDQDYVPEYYNDKPDFESADPVAVVAPNIVSGINASLQRGGSISGQVTGEDSGKGLPDVGVEVFNCYGFGVRSTTTDASGYYTVTGLLAGSYSVGFFPWNDGDSRAYLYEYFDNKASWEASNSVAVAAGEVTTGIDAALARGAQISGRVTAADGGAPLEDVDIEIYNHAGWYMSDTWTDATGVYTTAGLPSGDYYLRFIPYEWSASRDYAHEYYNNRPSYDDADPLALIAPNVLSGVDAVLERGGRISGRVTVEGSGAGLHDVWVDAYDQDTGQWDYAGVDNNGYYTIYGIASGNYEVDFYPHGDDAQYVWEYYNNKTPKQTPDPVVVSAPGEVSGIDAALALGGAIECSVKAQDTNQPLEDVHVVAYDSAGDWYSSVWTDHDGLCKFNGLPSDNYRLWFQTTIAYTYEACLITPVQYVEEYYNDKPDLNSADPISVSAPNVVTGIEALLAVGAPLPPIGRGNVFLPMVVKEP